MCLLPPLLSLPCCCEIHYSHAFLSEVLVAFAESREEHRWQDAMGGLPGVPASSPQGFKATQPLEKSITGTQACWCQVLCGISLPLPEAQLWETLPATLLPQCVFEYFTLSNFGKPLIEEEEFYLANVNCIYLGKGKK